MKSHAVPQEIMSVEFKLFGNFLSLREFIYIAVGIAFSYFIYFLMSHGIIPGILAWPAILIIGGGGTVISLVPFQGRSLETWIMNYFTAIQRPTKRVWQKKDFDPLQTASGATIVRKDHVVSPPVTSTAQPVPPANTGTQTGNATPLEQEESKRLREINTTIQQVEQGKSAGKPMAKPVVASTPRPMAKAVPKPVPSPTPKPIPKATPVKQPQVEPQTKNPAQRSQRSQPQKPATHTHQKTPQKTTPPAQHTASAQTGTPVQSAQPTVPAQPAVPVQTAQSAVPVQPVTSTHPAQPQTQPATPVQPMQSAQPATITITDKNYKDFATEIPGIQPQENTINLVITDQAGQFIPQTTCIIKDAEENPVRAAISNQLGQITNNVPLKKGTYKIQLSKHGYAFPVIMRVVSGKIYPPLEIKSL